MPKMVLLASHLEIDSNDLSDRCNKIELTAEVEEQDVTTFTSLGWKEVLGGLASGTLAVAFKNDMVAGQVDEIMWDLLRSVVPFNVRADQGAVTASNPQYSGNVLINAWNPIMGNVGDVNELDVSYPTSGEIVRATST